MKFVASTTWSTRNGDIGPDDLPRSYFPSFEESLSSGNYKPETLANYRYLFRHFGRLLEAEGIAPSALTPGLAVALGRRLPGTLRSQIKISNLARLFVTYLIEIGVATRPPPTLAQAERRELLSNFETYLLGQRGLSPRSVYHVLWFADRFLDHRLGNHVLDLPGSTPVMSWRSWSTFSRASARSATRRRRHICEASSSATLALTHKSA